MPLSVGIAGGEGFDPPPQFMSSTPLVGLIDMSWGSEYIPQITIAYVFSQYGTIFGLHEVAKAPRCNMLQETAAHFKQMRL